MAYSQEDLVAARQAMIDVFLAMDPEESLDYLWGAVKDANAIGDVKPIEPDVCEKLKNEHRCLSELDRFGPGGPVGIGLGRMGGHSIG